MGCLPISQAMAPGFALPLRILVTAATAWTLLIAGAPAHPGLAFAEGPVDFVFDLDDTLIRYLRGKESSRTQLIPAISEGKPYQYQVLDGAPEILLAAERGGRVSVFSFGDRARNRAVLSQLRLPDGRTALQLIESSGGKVLSLEDATMLADGNHKDLRKVNPDLSRVVMFEDNPRWILPGQNKSVVFIGGKPDHLPSALAQSAGTEAYLRVRNRLAAGWGIFRRSQHLAANQELSLHEALARVQADASILGDVRVYREGAREFHELNPRYRFTAALDGISRMGCIRSEITRNLAKP